MNEKMNKLVAPFLKWAGGKRQLLPEIRYHLPEGFSQYVEPFIGGGAVLFDLQPKKAIVNDVNSELINVYQTVRDNVDALIEDLQTHKNDSAYFYEIRMLDRNTDYDNLSDVKRASRIIFLNKTCFNGLFRVNSKGQYNVPFGKYKNPNIVNESALRAVSDYLNQGDVQFYNADFEELSKKIEPGSFVYLDPPYHPVSESSSFTSYALNGFQKEDQIRLKQTCDNLVDKGCKILLSNSYTPFILELYNDPRYNIIEIKASRAINSVASSRGKISEVLIKSY